MSNKSVITITYSEKVENHVGNQQIGVDIKYGITCDKLLDIQNKLKNDNFDCEIINLKDKLDAKYHNGACDAKVLIVRNFVQTVLKNKQTFQELQKLTWDTKALMRGTVKNKRARYNLCFSNFSQEPDYENGKGRVYNFNDVTDLKIIKEFLEPLVNINLNAEGNYYYDIDKCYIGFHGDTERKIVIGVRFGNTFPLYYRWYQYSKEISEPILLELHDGDMYIMSDKAVGHDWHKKNTITLRHAAGNLNNL